MIQLEEVQLQESDVHLASRESGSAGERRLQPDRLIGDGIAMLCM